MPAGAAKAPAGNDEKAWRGRFAALRHKLEQDQAELDVLQREVGVAEVQYYNGDPMKAQQDKTNAQELGAEYNKKVADIDAKKKQVEADQQAISDAEDDLRKAGGDSGWAR
jgi:chromosome segregation ATPase